MDISGVGLILLLVVISGFIAYIGDYVGRYVGKRRISIFGLRPKHSSIIVTIITGILIVSVTLAGVLSVSKWARTAFFGIQQMVVDLKQTKNDLSNLKQQYREEELKLQESIKQIQGQLEASRKEFAESQQALKTKQEQLDDILGEINLKSLELSDIYASSQEMAKRVDKLDREREDLEKKKTQLEKKIEDLKLEYASLIGETNQELLFGDIIYRKDQPLARTVIHKSMTSDEIETRMVRMLDNVFRRAIDSGALVEEEAGMLFDQQFKSLLDVLEQSGDDLIVEVRSHTNVLKGQPLYVTLNVVENKLVYQKRQIITEEIIKPGLTQLEISEILKNMLTEASAEARAAGLIPDPETGRVGSITAKRYLEVIKELSEIDEPRTVELYAVDDVRLSDRLFVDFRVI